MMLSNLNLLATAPGGVARLRELILTLAVQGKLVPQDPADEPASVLLQKIRAEKDRLIAEGKIKKDKPLAAIAEEENPFGLPVGWEWVRLGTLVDPRRTITYGVLKPGPDDKDGIPLVKTENVQFNHVLRQFNSRITPTLDEEYKRTRLLGGEVLITLVGSIGRCAIAPPEITGANLSRSVGMVVPLDGANKQFMVYSLTALISPKFVDQNCAGTAQKVLNIGTVDAMLYPLPPLAEQSRIVARVEELMRLCDALEAKGQLEATQHAQLLSTLLGTLTASATPEELANNWQRVAQHFDLLLDRPQAIDALEQTLLQLAVRGLLVPQDPTDEPASVLLQKIRAEKDRLIAAGQIKKDKPLPPVTDEEKPFELPVGWEWVRLSALLQKIGAGSTPLGGREVYVSSGVKFLRSQNVWDEGLRLDGVAFIKPETHFRMAGTVVVANDLLFNITGASIGRCAVVPSDFDEANVSQHVTIIRAVLPEINAYLHKVLVSRHVQQTVMDVQVGVSREGLSIAKLGQFLIPLPPLAEQSRIVARVTQLRRLCFELRQRLAEREAVQARLAEALVQQVA